MQPRVTRSGATGSGATGSGAAELGAAGSGAAQPGARPSATDGAAAQSSRRARVLLVEDSQEMATVIEAMLASAPPREVQYETTTAATLREARALLRDREFDLLILDVGLPDGSGLGLCADLHRAGGPPVIIISAAGTPDERIAGFDAGADDYMPKPLHPVELHRRVRAILRRTRFDDDVLRATGPLGIELDLRTGATCYQGATVLLSRSELGIFRLLIERTGTAQTTEELIRRVWNYEDIGNSNFLHQHVSRLRKKLSGIGYPDQMIQTVYGIGYSLIDPTPTGRDDAPRRA